MRIDIITLFPNMFHGPFQESILKRAQDMGKVTINIVNLRDFTHDRHRTVDDKPYGGGPGMLLKPEPVFEAVKSCEDEVAHCIYLTPQGERFNQTIARELAKKEHIVMLCGHYEGLDERARKLLFHQELSIGDFVLTNGNLPAMVITDAVVRLLPGVLGCDESVVEESFSEGLLEYPQYTRPPVFQGMKVPDILLSGNHQAIQQWRKEQARARTLERRPDLLAKHDQ